MPDAPDSKTDRRVALITGGAKRVGRAIVQRLLNAGFDVAFTYLKSHSEAQDLQRESKPALPGRVLAIQADLTNPDRAPDHIVSTFNQTFARLDVLVNSASIYQPGDDKLGEMFAIHVESPLKLCRAFAPLLRASRGHIVNLLDLLAERPWPQYAAYCATKAALLNLTMSLARELAPEVTVNGIAPGVVEWPVDYPEPEREKYLKRVPLARAGTPQDVASLVHYLVTEGSYITGQIIRLDGGRSIT
jgi:pteridine reductase